MKIKFGTDGWRAIIAREFTVDNVARVAEGTAKWLKAKSNGIQNPTVVVGHDCRFAGQLFAETVAEVLAGQGIKVYLAKGFVSTPMISLAAVQYKTSLGIIITASHNPPEYNGFKLKGSYGGPLTPSKVQEIENMIPDEPEIRSGKKTISDFESDGLIQYVNLELHQACSKEF